MNDEFDSTNDGPRKVADIMAHFPEDYRHSLLAGLAEDQRLSIMTHFPAAMVKAMNTPAPCFTPDIGHQVQCFNDLILADDNQLQLLAREISTDNLCFALIGADDPLRQRFYDNLSSRFARMLAEDVNYFKDIVDEALVIQAQREVLNLVNKRVNQGELKISVETAAVDGMITANVDELMHQLHTACINTMAWVMIDYPYKLAAAILCQRMDRHRILLCMLLIVPCYDVYKIPVSGVDKVTAILACMRNNVRDPLVKHLQPFRPDIADKVLRFDDLSEADDTGLQYLMKDTETATLCDALSGKDEPFRQRFYQNMGDRAARLIADDIDYLTTVLPPIDLISRQISSQQTIVDIAVALRKEGLLQLDSLGEQAEKVRVDAINNEMEGLQFECNKTIAELLVDYPDELVAGVLLQRQDRLQILLHILQMDGRSAPNHVLTEEEVNSLMNAIEDDDDI
ncbi:MAG: hypothetical protein MJK04_24705 [Psychrosphaera sp.]|nr:hypothetical protein [Psychrosphaera sp.]